jgi:hypothetical protein
LICYDEEKQQFITSRRKEMSCQQRLSQWTKEVSTAFAHLSKPQIWGLVLWSAGIALSGTAGITQISALLAFVLYEREQTVFQRLREWYLDADQKSGTKRRELLVSTCFAPLLAWVVRLWPSDQRQLPLVLDATALGNRWTILVISVVIRGCAIPVAWKVLPAQQEGSWRPYWEALLNALGQAVPPEWEVLVLADRGLYARWLWEAIRAWGWHPFLRINLGCKARLPGEEHFDWISRWVPTPGTSWQGQVECFASKKGRVTGTLLMHWEPGYECAWVILTDLDPQQAKVSWYGLRTWTEGGFKDFKRGLWGWQQSTMERASSVERLWLAMALAQLWCVSLGCQAEAQLEAQVLDNEPGAALPVRHIAHRRRKRAPGQLPARRLSCVVRGKLILLASQCQPEPLPIGILQPGPWPESITAPQKQPKPLKKKKTHKEKERRKRQKRRARQRCCAHR